MYYMPTPRKQARKEAALLDELSHPSIVGFLESFFHGSSPGVLLCIVMEYADGGDLDAYMARQGGGLLEEDLILDW